MSVVIRCYNEVEHIGRLFEGLGQQSFQDFEIVVVDSGSDDGTLEVVALQKATLLHIPKENFSFGRSLNWGCQAAKGEYLVFISAHCYPTHPQWLENLLAGFRDAEVAAVYGKQRGAADSHFSERRVFRQWFPDESVARQEGPFSNNANCAIRKTLWEELPYDEELTGLEDVAWATEMIRRGWWISYAAYADVVHVHDESMAQTRNRYRREAITFQKVFPNEHFSFWDFVRLTCSNTRTDWREARQQRRLAIEWFGIARFRLAQFLGTYQGFRSRRPTSSALKRRFYYPEERR